ncbi:MAG: hypothetical protein ACT6S0_24360 [Roseateles sp.]|uniref:hypothetical protein n=1 Tax=Roseateles sp. TaxID=1971397 RepID=UPI0040370085
MSNYEPPRHARHLSRESEERWHRANNAYAAEFARAIRDPRLWRAQLAVTAALALRFFCVPLACGCLGGAIAWAMGLDSGAFAAVGFTAGTAIAWAIMLFKPTFAARSLFHERADAAFDASLKEYRRTQRGPL